MKHRLSVAAACAAMFALITPSIVYTQGATQAPVKLPAAPLVTLKVTVVISRWEGEKKIGNAPFVLMVVPSEGKRAEAGIEGDATTIQMGSDYPLPSLNLADVKEGKPTPTVSYKPLGTNLSASARPLESGQYVVAVSVQDTQLDKPQGATMTHPRFQTFKSSNRLTLRDGQTVQYTVATDTITGQVIKMDVMLNVLK